MCLGQNDYVDLKYSLRNLGKIDIIKQIEYAMTIKPQKHNFEIFENNNKINIRGVYLLIRLFCIIPIYF